MFVGLPDRLLNEVRKLSVKDTKIKIYAPPERKYSTWIGGSILAGLNTFKKVLLSNVARAHLLLTFHIRRCGFLRRNIKKTQILSTRNSASSNVLRATSLTHFHFGIVFHVHLLFSLTTACVLRIPRCNTSWAHGIHLIYDFNRLNA